MARVIIHMSTHRETNIPQLAREEVLKCLKSLEYDPKPDDLTLSKVKRW